jgi:hypothetical protein
MNISEDGGLAVVLFHGDFANDVVLAEAFA